MRTLPCLIAAASMLSACATGNYQTVAADPPGDALSQIMAECQEQALAPEFDLIRSRVNMSVIGAAPAPFMLASMDFPTAAERIEIARWSEIRDSCSQRVMALINDPPAGMAQGLWQKVVEITQYDSQRQHALMMALARGEMPYGQFVQESTLISVRTTAAVWPFIQEAGVIDQVAMIGPATDQGAAALGVFLGNLLGATLESLGDAADAGTFNGGSHYHHASGRR
jgi:hypothetical protein